MKSDYLLAIVVTVALLAGCAGCSKPASPAETAAVVQSVVSRPVSAPVSLHPPLEQIPAPPPGPDDPGEFYRTELLGGDIVSRKIWIYKPFAAKTKPVRCVVMAPAGSHLFDGMNLAEGDAQEHTYYFAGGYAVIACEVDGAIPDGQENDDKAVVAGAKAFVAAKAGIRNVQAAIDVAESLPWIDKKHIYVAGHSSAATLALQAAAFDSRVAGCIALAPEVNVPRFVQGAGAIERAGAPGLQATLAALSPHNNIARLTKPVFLSVASDDDVVRPADVKGFAETLQKTNPATTFLPVASGGHFDGMMKEGRAGALEWLNKQP